MIEQTTDVVDRDEQTDAETAAVPSEQDDSQQMYAINVGEFLFLAGQVNAQAHAALSMDIDQLDLDGDGIERFRRLYGRHRRSARDLAPPPLFEMMTRVNPPLPRPSNRPPTAAEIQSAFAGLDSWCRFVASSVQQRAAAPQLTGGSATPDRPGQYL